MSSGSASASDAIRTHVCGNCTLDEKMHIDGKCPFEATTYVDMPYLDLFNGTLAKLKLMGPGSQIEKDYLIFKRLFRKQ